MSVSKTAPADPTGQLAQERRTEAFKDGLIREIPNLRAFAASLSGSMQLADDLVQDTLLKAWGNSDKFEPGTSLRAWLFTILRNTYYSLYRKRGREVQDSEGTYAERMATHGNQESHLDLADFRKALAKLPEEQREVLIMVGATGLSYEEAADICGVAIGTIKSRVNRARTKLAELLSIGSVDDLGPGRTNAAAMQRAGSEPVGS
ncbi:sigma-70 family RNA polymerase sigma factor [Bosea sp. (in: a-proteobacteria)]|uniref:sigma-70 family RNA polymerase sigma factor n=1 Tax=Bosea sp. (in: a-proteobacteria) TaxID=1871050 RepID=UPI00261CB5C0|nr:sigma-70 family RNA polymerase sigma factor [Bosea sp. (in: a-proteobacteria)]MCO5090330.1 sigma-70 family RNA polymerase sigma factor [Bosea sp. (in: a-proteobacteria)]